MPYTLHSVALALLSHRALDLATLGAAVPLMMFHEALVKRVRSLARKKIPVRLHEGNGTVPAVDVFVDGVKRFLNPSGVFHLPPGEYTVHAVYRDNGERAFLTPMGFASSTTVPMNLFEAAGDGVTIIVSRIAN